MGTKVARGRRGRAGDAQARTTRAVSPDSGRSTYWSAVGSVHIGRYSALPLGKGVAQRSGHQRLAFRGMTNALREMHQDDDKQARKNA
ncbi:hypothetical protein BHE74_00035423 [Ensete ventricosum]|nr:hypothetical protein BHE74_00035423 [Ensete ventricosum]RZS26973.1 hypothetical protein BHM03_00060396 [Ensete ventricosum]